MGYYDHLRNNYSQLCADTDMNLNEFFFTLFSETIYILNLSHQIYHACSSRGSEEVMFVFGVIRNPRWTHWP
jgi:hypothetical protein